MKCFVTNFALKCQLHYPFQRLKCIFWPPAIRHCPILLGCFMRILSRHAKHDRYERVECGEFGAKAWRRRLKIQYLSDRKRAIGAGVWKTIIRMCRKIDGLFIRYIAHSFPSNFNAKSTFFFWPIEKLSIISKSNRSKEHFQFVAMLDAYGISDSTHVLMI